MLLRPLLDLVFPPRCEVCRGSGPEPLCAACLAQIKFMKPQLGVHAATVYDGVVRDALHRLKFQNRRKLAEALGVVLVQYLAQVESLKITELDWLVPVPLHPKRARERGFNQVELLARVIGRYYELPVRNALARIRNTHAQFALPREARSVNVRGAFQAVDRSALAGRRVLLLDDIFTTGATAAECARTLLAAGAKRVEVLALSRAVD
jgi:ComF family protein